MDSNQKRSQALKIYWQHAFERKSQLSNKMSGENNPAKSILVRKKISESKYGKLFKHTHPLSIKQKMHLLRLAEQKRGKKLGQETRLKISISRKGKCKGQENYFYGKHHTKTSIQKMKAAHRLIRERHSQEIFERAKSLGFEIDRDSTHDKIGDTLQTHNRTDPLGYIIGTIPTDAYFGKPRTKDNYVYSISAKDNDFIEKVADCFKKIFGFRPNLYRQRNLYRIQISKKRIAQFLKFIKKEDDNQWLFSENILNLEQEFFRAILMAVSDAEGCVTNSSLKDNIISRKITITNSSLALLKQIKLLLELLKIQSYIYHHREPRIVRIRRNSYQFKKHVFILIITGYQNLQRFRDVIGFSIKRKQHKLEYILASYKKIHCCYSQNEYNIALKLAQYFSNCSDIARLINIPAHIVRNWVLYNRKPRSVKMKQSI